MQMRIFRTHGTTRKDRTRAAAQRAAKDDVMTDEAYIDDLFAREGIGWDQTRGFRAFVLDLMGIIGERPRAGDVSSMHLAYKAGLEHGREWTDERPTEPGEYWLSFHPDNRNRFRSMPAVVAASVIERKDSLYALWGDVIRTPQVMLDLNDSRLLDGAKWSRRETPADPFKEVGT